MCQKRKKLTSVNKIKPLCTTFHVGIYMHINVLRTCNAFPMSTVKLHVSRLFFIVFSFTFGYWLTYMKTKTITVNA